jgi:hypothetical protein
MIVMMLIDWFPTTILKSIPPVFGLLQLQCLRLDVEFTNRLQITDH